MQTLGHKLRNLFSGSRIGRRLIAYVLVFSTLVTLLVSAVHFKLAYEKQLEKMNAQFEQIEGLFIKSIENALWRLDQEVLESLLLGVFNLEDISYVDLVDRDGDLSSTLGTIPERTVSRTFNLFYIQDGAETPLGTLRVDADFGQISDRVYLGLGIILLENAIVIFSLAIFIFFFVQESITRHLSKISDYAKKVEAPQSEETLVLSKGLFKTSGKDELDEVVSSIDEMQRNLQAGYRALVASEERLKVFAEAASDWLWEMDSELKYTYVSNRFFEITGFSQAAVIGKDQTSLYEGPPENREWQQHQTDLADRRPFRDYTLSLTSPLGETRWLRISGRPIFGENRQFEGYRGTGTDITNEVRAREEAIETTLRFLDAIENVSDGIAFWDSNDQFVLCNRIFRAQAGAAAASLVRGTPYEDYMRTLIKVGAVNKTGAEGEAWIKDRLAEREHQTVPNEVYRVGRWLLIRDGRSSDGSTVSVATDITEVKQREQQLQQVTDAVPTLLAYVDNDLRYQMVNKEYELCFSISREEAIGAKFEDSFAEETFEQFAEHIDTVLAGTSTRFQLHLSVSPEPSNTQDTIRHLDTSFTPNISSDGKVSGFFIAAIDVTDLVKAEENARRGEFALSEQTQILRASFEAMAQGISIWDENKKLIIWNRTFESFMHFPDKFLQRGLSMEDALEKAKSIVRNEPGIALASSSDEIDTLFNRETSKSSTIKYEDGQILVGENYVTSTDGFILMLTDVTEQILAQEQLQHSQKIDAIGQLTGGVAHDFNNLLAIIIGSLNLLEDRTEEERARKLVSSALRASRRGAELTQRLLAFGRRQALVKEQTNANELVEGITDLLTRTLGVGIEIIPKLGDNLWSMEVDRGQLENALLNLAINARDAMPDGGTLTIETSNILLGKDYARRHQDVEPGAFVMISVIDSGVGMSAKVVERAIEPFFTTKKEGAGSGLGLSMIYGFANQSGGHLSIYSEPGHGTAVRIYLPAMDGEISQSEQSQELTDFKSRGEHILVIEDDDDVRITTTHMLSELGYQVTEARNDEEALGVIESGIRIDLVFSDVFLQGSETGPEIVKKIRAQYPSMKILFTSGYTADQFEDEDFQANNMGFIPKPFEISSLSKKLRDIFDGNS